MSYEEQFSKALCALKRGDSITSTAIAKHLLTQPSLLPLWIHGWAHFLIALAVEDENILYHARQAVAMLKPLSQEDPDNKDRRMHLAGAANLLRAIEEDMQSDEERERVEMEVAELKANRRDGNRRKKEKEERRRTKWRKRDAAAWYAEREKKKTSGVSELPPA